MPYLHQHYRQRNPHAIAAHQSGARFLVICTGRRGGKTTLAPEEGLHRIYTQDLPAAMRRPYNPGNARPGSAEWWRRPPRLRYWAVAPEFSLIDEMKARFSQAIPRELIAHQSTSPPAWWLHPDVLIEFKSAHNPDNLRSVGCHGIFLDEAAFMHPEAWKGALRYCLSDTGGWCIATTTPMGRNWFYEDFIRPAEEGQPEYSFHTWVTEDNARWNELPELLADVELARKTMAPEYFRREMEASLDAFIGQVFVEWDSRKYGLRGDELEKRRAVGFRRVLGGADWGFSNPGCLGVVGLGELFSLRLDEVYKKSELVEDFWAPEALRLMSVYGFREWICDPAEPDNLLRFKKAGNKLGISVTGHRNFGSGKFDEHPRSVLSGIRLMASQIHQGRLLYDATRCADFGEEMTNYVWDTRSSRHTDKGTDAVMLENPAPHQADHAIATERYVLTHGLRPAGVVGLR